MALSIVDCPSCRQQLRVPADLSGQRVKCPRCYHQFDAVAQAPAPVPVTPPPVVPPGPAPLPAGTPPAATADDPGYGYVQVADEQTEPAPPRNGAARKRRCPECGERVGRAATYCPECGINLDGSLADWERERRDREPHRGTTILLLGVGGLVVPFLSLPFIGLPLSLAAWIMGRRDLRRMDQGEMDLSGRGTTQAGLVCGIIGTIINSVACVGIAGMIALIILAAGSASRRPPAVAPPRPVPVQPAPMPGGPPALVRPAWASEKSAEFLCKAQSARLG